MVEITLDGETITHHYREKAKEIGFDLAVKSLLEISNISKDDAVAVLNGTKRFGNDESNNIVIINEREHHE